ncbi:dihydrodipicolinate synthase family protein [Paenibacillus motobuensis]|uniref:dihydrodipicolinate synthase family protein n=1 Tax=Paenibacillus TaxID=44249 RepID=UPI00203AF2BB|nr:MULTISPECIES: dihydrodipicolinate synthase family protein [Paenibacillus]MCM3039177.1 dihydrodipicolinate synthase family protein [Paenibacillus lutimineralis]MCM3646281.1 dihydrodipicolinate synthase family protein [Paenibacillus motobuensis]
MLNQPQSHIPNGVWPTMVTPFKENGEIDYFAQERAVEWYIRHGVDGLFAVCQSSEMFHLSLEERVKLASFVKEKAAGQVPVIASGHISDDIEDQIEELTAMAATGIDALVLITNRLAREDESDDVWKINLEKLLRRLPEDIPLSFYECPYPYKRIISPELLRWCASTGRFHFLKDTSCDTDNIQQKLKAVQHSSLKIYNANSATLLETLRLGIAGYSGVMANFHPDLYVWLLRNWENEPNRAETLINFLSMTSLIEKQLYPVNAKYYLMLEGVFDNYYCRVKNHHEFTATNRLEIHQLHQLSRQLSDQFII